jgi:hypothetical protein
VIERTNDVERVNLAAGIDLSEFLAEPLNVCLIDGDSGALFAFRGPGIYEVHVFLKEHGKDAIDLIRAMLDLMREAYGARFFWTMVPEESREVRMFARLVGWKSHGLRETRHGPNELFSSESELCLQS